LIGRALIRDPGPLIVNRRGLQTAVSNQGCSGAMRDWDNGLDRAKARVLRKYCLQPSLDGVGIQGLIGANGQRLIVSRALPYANPALIPQRCLGKGLADIKDDRPATCHHQLGS
jgi:hypothetical protein